MIQAAISRIRVEGTLDADPPPPRECQYGQMCGNTVQITVGRH